jgi:hypothetical protein
LQDLDCIEVLLADDLQQIYKEVRREDGGFEYKKAIVDSNFQFYQEDPFASGVAELVAVKNKKKLHTFQPHQAD